MESMGTKILLVIWLLTVYFSYAAFTLSKTEILEASKTPVRWRISCVLFILVTDSIVVALLMVVDGSPEKIRELWWWTILSIGILLMDIMITWMLFTYKNILNKYDKYKDE